MPFVFDFAENLFLEDERVLLRPLQSEDYHYLLEFSLNEPEIWKYSLLQAGSEEKLKEYIKTALQARAEKKEFPFIVFDKQIGKYAGSTRYYDIQLSNSTLQLGYTWYGKQFQGTGLNKHCKYLLLEYAFDTLGMERVEFRADNKNEKSIAAMKSIGCTVEGILRSNMPNADGGRRDSIVLSILKEEWNTEIRDKLKEKLHI